MKPKVVSIFGVRSDAIKMAPVVNALKNQDKIDSIVLATGQHSSMLDEVLELFDIVPDYNLKLMNRVSSMIDFIATAMVEIGQILAKEKPDLVLVHGDTNTSIAGSLAGLYSGIKVAHIEGGLRSGDKYNPFPEEINRRLDDIISELYFVPTSSNRKNLDFKEYNQEHVFITGNTGIDALLSIASEEIKTDIQLLQEIYDSKQKIIAVTMHRRENWGESFKNTLDAFKQIVENEKDVVIVYPVHLNPNVKDVAYAELEGIDRIVLTEPLNYREFAGLMQKSQMIITDSGGIQKEAPALGKPVLVIRDNTERWEAVEAGTVKLIGSNTEKIVSETHRLLHDKDYYESMAGARNPYGDGKATDRIIEYLYYYFGLRDTRPDEFPG